MSSDKAMTMTLDRMKGVASTLRQGSIGTMGGVQIIKTPTKPGLGWEYIRLPPHGDDPRVNYAYVPKWQRSGGAHFYGDYKLRYQHRARRWVISKRGERTCPDVGTAPTFMVAKVWVESTVVLEQE